MKRVILIGLVASLIFTNLFAAQKLLRIDSSKDKNELANVTKTAKNVMHVLKKNYHKKKNLVSNDEFRRRVIKVREKNYDIEVDRHTFKLGGGTVKKYNIDSKEYKISKKSFREVTNVACSKNSIFCFVWVTKLSLDTDENPTTKLSLLKNNEFLWEMNVEGLIEEVTLSDDGSTMAILISDQDNILIVDKEKKILFQDKGCDGILATFNNGNGLVLSVTNVTKSVSDVTEIEVGNEIKYYNFSSADAWGHVLGPTEGFIGVSDDGRFLVLYDLQRNTYIAMNQLGRKIGEIHPVKKLSIIGLNDETLFGSYLNNQNEFIFVSYNLNSFELLRDLNISKKLNEYFDLKHKVENIVCDKDYIYIGLPPNFVPVSSVILDMHLSS